jgi:GntR family transcriptional regulator, rspAB operon transcriptional repressor
LTTHDSPAGSGHREGGKPTASDMAYAAIRDLILKTELKPGQALSESAMSSRLQIGRTPLRDALRLLSHDGLVVIEPRRGTMVAPLTISDLDAIFEARIAIESVIADAAIARASAQDIADIGSLAEQAEANSAEQSDTSLDEQLHRKVADISRNRFLVDFHKRLRDESLRFRFLTGSGIDTKEDQSAFFRGVKDSLAAHDREQLSNLLVAHVEEFRQAAWKALSRGRHTDEILIQDSAVISLDTRSG